MTRSSGTVVFRFNPQKREPPRRNGLGCHKTERPGLTAPCMIVVCRICHASPARGVFQTADGFGCIAPRYRFAHNGRRIPQGLPRKSVGGREQVSLSTALSSRPDCQHRVKGCVDRSGSLSLIPLKAACFGGAPYVAITRISYREYCLFSFQGEEENSSHLSGGFGGKCTPSYRDFFKLFFIAASPRSTEQQMRLRPTPSAAAISALLMPRR